MQSTDAQVRKLRAEMNKHGKIGVAAARAGMHRNTAAKYVREGKLPSELRRPRSWRTRKDPFEEEWPEIAKRLAEEPELEAKTLFEELLEEKRGKHSWGQLRTFQRRVKQWRAQEGPEKEIFFPQEHRAGEAAQTDFTSMTRLGITIAGERFEHLLCHTTLPYSDWSWGTPCRSESMAALKKGVQEAFFRLGHVPFFHQTDNSTAATHDLRTGKRGFNREYLELMHHLGMTPRTTGIGKKEQNGDIEANNGALKRHVEQRLLLRGSRDFESYEQYSSWLAGVFEKRNGSRRSRLEEELAVMRPLSVRRLPEFSEMDVRVGESGTIRVKGNTYSVPSRLKGEKVRVRVHDDRLEIRHGQKLMLVVERLHGKKAYHINYRHVIHSLLRKPGAFRRYRYREALFPSGVFHRALDTLDGSLSQRQADIEYLRVLHLAATTMETEVEQALSQLLADGTLPTAMRVKAIVAPKEAEVPEMAPPRVDLTDYDSLLDDAEEVPA